MACLGDGAAALPSSSGGSGRDPAVFSCFEQAMQVNMVALKPEANQPEMQQPISSVIERKTNELARCLDKSIINQTGLCYRTKMPTLIVTVSRRRREKQNTHNTRMKGLFEE